jgi:hypothetical protein
VVLGLKNVLLIGLLLLILVSSGCLDSPASQQVTPEIVCNSPYIRFGSTCCLDQNSDNVCDNDETTATTQQEIIQKKECFIDEITLLNEPNKLVKICNNYADTIDFIKNLTIKGNQTLDDAPPCIDFGVAHTNGNYVLLYNAKLYDRENSRILPLSTELSFPQIEYAIFYPETKEFGLFQGEGLSKYNIEITKFESLIENPKLCTKETAEEGYKQIEERIKMPTEATTPVMSSEVSSDIVKMIPEGAVYDSFFDVWVDVETDGGQQDTGIVQTEIVAMELTGDSDLGDSLPQNDTIVLTPSAVTPPDNSTPPNK